MKIAFRISKMGRGGAERVFLSVADVFKNEFNADIEFVVDELGKGETEHVVMSKGFKLLGLSSSRTIQSVLPLKKYIETSKPDVLISAYTDTNMAAILSTKLAKHNCKIIVSEHASLKEHWQYYSTKRKILLNTYVKYGYCLADHILGVSEGIAKSIKSLGHSPKNVSVIYNPVRFDARVIETKHAIASPPKILAVGRITKQKDYLTLLKAFNLLIKKTEAKLVIVGSVKEPIEKAKMDAYIENNNLSSTVELVDFTEDIQDYYAAADLFVLSSAWEGFGNVIVEALAHGLPVVSTNCNYGPAEILEEGKYGQLVPIGHPAALALALEETIKNINTIDTEALKNRSIIFSEKNIANQYWTLIKKVLHL